MLLLHPWILCCALTECGLGQDNTVTVVQHKRQFFDGPKLLISLKDKAGSLLIYCGNS